MPEGKRRSFLTSYILILILLANFQLTIGGFTFSLSFAALLMMSFCLSARLPKTAFHLIVSFIVMLGYTAIHIWYFSSPLQFFSSPARYAVAHTFLLAILLAKGFWNRLVSCLSGMVGGEWLYSFILASYSFPDVIGDMRFLDSTVIFVAVLICQSLLSAGKRKLKELVNRAVLKPRSFVKKKAQ